MSLDGWVDNIRLRRAHASALDKFTSRSVFAQLCATFYGWLGTLEDEKRSRWVAVRVERNSAKVLMSACIGHWRIESRALARARRRKAEEEAALDRAQRREADRVAILNDMSELLKRRRHQGGSPAENSVRPPWSRCLVCATVLRGALPFAVHGLTRFWLAGTKDAEMRNAYVYPPVLPCVFLPCPPTFRTLMRPLFLADGGHGGSTAGGYGRRGPGRGGADSVSSEGGEAAPEEEEGRLRLLRRQARPRVNAHALC